MRATPGQVEAAADHLEQTMRHLGAWSDPPPPLLPFRAPFGMDAMPFEHWIQLELVPRLRDVARTGAPMPPSSNLAGHAVREFDGRDDRHPLVEALRRVDALSGPAPIRPVGTVPNVFGIVSLGGLAAVVGVLVAVAAGDGASSALRGFFPPTVSAAYGGNIPPSDAHVPLRVLVIAAVGEDGALEWGEGHVLLHGRGIPTPGTRVVPPPLVFSASTPPEAGAVRDWLVGSGVDPAASGVGPAAEEIAHIIAVASAVRTRGELHDVASRLPLGLPEPQILDIEARTPAWLEMTVGLGAALLLCVPVLVFAIRRRRRRAT